MNRRDDDTYGEVAEAADDSRPVPAGDSEVAAEAEADTAVDTAVDSALDTEVDILRFELAALRERSEAISAEAAKLNERYLRARAEFETYRRRMDGEKILAREAGLDSALLPVITVFDDLGRALEAAEKAADPSSIVPGVRAVHDNLLRALEGLGVKMVGLVGERFDPSFHEAVAAIPAARRDQAGTIAHLHRAGFAKGERVIRPAAVTVFQE